MSLFHRRLPIAGLAAFLAAASAGASAGAAHAQIATGDPVSGHRIADTWCGNCHVVSRSPGSTTTDTAPTFESIARMPSTTTLSLRAFLQTPHRSMPDYQLSRTDLDDVIAYILSLRGR